ncbi:hypothetical protein F3Y22_tig00110560pilonHSYRG00060 [Hibiscus syriacus]|uniref:Uncharacterized protein n=1 Tax=Hibiscus syriacus TaxID=106335 RepID=A0A6A3A722_HIBSY|nr:hypothetical protein F3Y22_tig00110560pilonHSYRG00060 [Hibiscus syriacus]
MTRASCEPRTGSFEAYKKEKLSHFKLYWHDIVGGRNLTAVLWLCRRRTRRRTEVLLRGISVGSWAVDGHEFRFHGREIQWDRYNDTGEEHCVLQSEGDANDRREWTFPVC